MQGTTIQNKGKMFGIIFV